MSYVFQGCFLLLFGRLADLYGRKKVFIMGSLFLTVFSLGLGFSNGITFALVIYRYKMSNINVTDEVTIDILRGFQGIGTAATIPSAVRPFPCDMMYRYLLDRVTQIGILAHAFPPSNMRSIAFSTFSAGAPTGAALGLILGGVLTQESKCVDFAQFHNMLFNLTDTTGRLGALPFICRLV